MIVCFKNVEKIALEPSLVAAPYVTLVRFE